jgi:hypothetical protein
MLTVAVVMILFLSVGSGLSERSESLGERFAFVSSNLDALFSKLLSNFYDITRWFPPWLIWIDAPEMEYTDLQVRVRDPKCLGGSSNRSERLNRGLDYLSFLFTQRDKKWCV